MLFMKNSTHILLFFTIATFISILTTQAQSKINLGRPLNNPQTSEQNPSISGNGKYLVLETDYGFEGFYPVITQQIAYMWSRPEEILGVYSKLTNDRDWNLNYEGTILYFASTRHGGLGSSDIWFTKKNNSTWSTPVNLAKPLNSTLSETDPSISADGKTLYFVRQNGQKTPEGKDCGSIWVSTMQGNTWSDPQKLPVPINSGCECSPTILTDNQTLIFASSRTGGKGGLDLYKSVFSNNTWSAPVPLSFVNTPKDDYTFAVSEKGDFAIIQALEHEKNDLFKIKIPEEFRPLPHKVMYGKVLNASTLKPVPAKIEIFGQSKLTKIAQLYTYGSLSQFQVILTGEKKQFLSVSPLSKEYFHELLAVNLDNIISDTIELTPFSKGTIKQLEHVDLNQNQQFTPAAKLQLDQLVLSLQANPTFKIEIAIHSDQVLKDSISYGDLTEKDSVVSQKTVYAPKENKELSASDTLSSPKMSPILENVTIYFYHNNRTQKEADGIKKYLISKGIAAERITAKGYGDSKNKTINSASKRLIECIVL